LRKLTKTFLAWRDYLILLTAVLASLAMLFLANDMEKIWGIHALTIELIGRLASPVSTVKQLMDIREENQKLQQQNFVLQLQNSQLIESHQENLRLRQLIGMAPYQELNGVPAKVVGHGSQVGLNSLLFDIGASAGIKPNMAIVAAEGLVGKVVAVAEKYSTGQILLDRNFRVGARVQRSRVEGLFLCANGIECKFEGATQRADIKVGDTIITTGLNSMFPPGLRIGTVTQVSDTDLGLFEEVTVKPNVNFEKLEEVFILRYQPSIE